MNTKKTLIIVGIVIASVFLIGIVMIKILVSPTAVAQLVIPRLQEKLGRPVNVGDAELTIFSGVGARIHNLQVANNPPFESRPLATMQAVDVKVSLLSLLGGKLRLKKLIATGCEVYLIKDSLGLQNYSFSGLKKPAAQKSEKDMTQSIRLFALRNSRFLYRDDSLQTRTVMGNLNLDIDLGSGDVPEIDGEVQVDTLFVWSRWGNFLIPANALESQFQGSYALGSDSLVVKECDWRIDKIRGRLEGSVADLFRAPDFSLRFLSERNDLVDFYDSRIVAALPVIKDAKLSGNMRIEIGYRGKLNDEANLNLRGKVNVTDATVKLPDNDVELKANLIESNFNEKSMSCFTEGAVVGGTPATFRLAIDDYRDPTYSGELKFSGDAGMIGQVLNFDKAKQLSGKVDATLSGFLKPSEEQQARLFGTLLLEGIGYRDPAAQLTIDTLNVSCNFAGGDAEIAGMSVVIDGKTLQLTGKITDFAPYLSSQRKPSRRPLFTFMCAADSFDFDRLTASSVAERDTSIVTRILDYLFDFDSQGTIQVNSGRFRGTDFRNLKADVAVVNRLIHSDSVECRIFDGESFSDVVIDVSEITAPEFEIDCRASEVDANAFLSTLTDFGTQISGKLDLESTFKGKGFGGSQLVQSLSASGKGSISDGRTTDMKIVADFKNRFSIDGINDGEFEDLKATFNAFGGSVRFDVLSFKTGKTVYQVEGNVGFDGSLDLWVGRTLNKDESRSLWEVPGTQDLFKESNAKKAVFRITGTADNPIMELESVSSQD